MPHLAAVALDSLIAPGTSKSSAEKSKDDSMTVSGHPLSPKWGSGKKLENVQRRVPQMIPSLYTTPEVTPLPDSPSSFPPSPYVVDHKRRGPRLAKNPLEVTDPLSLENVAEKPARTSTPRAVKPAEDVPFTVNVSDPVNDSSANGPHEFSNGEAAKSNFVQKENSIGGLIEETDSRMSVSLTPTKEGDSEGFYDPRDSMSCSSNTDVEDYGSPSARKLKIASSGGEFYDAWEELSSENGHQSSLRALEDELRETRLSLLMEIDRRKQAEEALRNMQNRWQTMREQLSLVGITLPAHPTEDSEQLGVEELSQQVQLARFVSESVGRGIAKAEVETVVGAQLEAKNFEITRLSDRLHYYETVNREMSQRNQEGIEISRRRRQLRRRKRRWIWGSVAAMLAVGATAVVSWSYLHTPATPSSEVDSLPKNVRIYY